MNRDSCINPWASKDSDTYHHDTRRPFSVGRLCEKAPANIRLMRPEFWILFLTRGVRYIHTCAEGGRYPSWSWQWVWDNPHRNATDHTSSERRVRVQPILKRLARSPSISLLFDFGFFELSCLSTECWWLEWFWVRLNVYSIFVNIDLSEVFDQHGFVFLHHFANLWDLLFFDV